MPFRRSGFALCAGLAATLATAAWAGPPAGAELRDASVAIGYEIKSRCPDLMQADVQEPGAVLVVLVVGPSGVPTQPSVKSSSGSDGLDAQALSCVMKLRFLPAVRAGDGTAVASWQEIAWKWGRGHMAQTSAGGNSSAAPPAVPTPVAAAGAMTPAASPAAPAGTEVRVCTDDGGKLRQEPVVTRSSGDAGLDARALGIARAGSAGLAGCADLTIRLEHK